MFVNQMPAFLDTFALGMAAAELHVMLSARRHSAVTRMICSAVAVLAIVKIMDVVYIHVFVGDVITLRRAQMEQRLALCFWAALLLLASAHAGLIVRRLMGNRATRFLSSVSMNFYIWHQTLSGWLLRWNFPASRTPDPHNDPARQIAYTIACFAIALAVAVVLTYGFERPAARRLSAAWKRFRQRRTEAA